MDICTTINPLVHLNPLLNPLTVIFSDKVLIIVEISSFQFAEIFNSNKMQLRKI